MDLFDQLRVFVRVAETGGFTAAADQLGLPRPTVSLAIQQLEQRLGVRLFNRTTRRVSLTTDGQALQRQAASLVDDVQALLLQFGPAGGALTGRLRVDLPSRIARRLVAPALPQFLQRHPALVLELGSSDRAIDLVQEGIDCALRVGELAPSSLVARPLGRLRLIHCASPAYLAAHGMPRSPDDLARHQVVNYASPGSGQLAPWEWLDGDQLRSRMLPGPVTVNNAETYIACCLAGLGLIQIPAFDVGHHLQAGDLVELLPDWPPPSMPVQLVYPHRRHLSQRVQLFAGWLDELLAPHLA